jgi:iron-sulfur cluster assembly protein
MSTLKVSESAKAELLRLVEMESDSQKYLRVGVKGGGCSGLSYLLEFDVPTEQDQWVEVDGLKILVNKAHELYLVGTTLNYEPGLGNRGFVFENPNAKETCGCGESFSI